MITQFKSKYDEYIDKGEEIQQELNNSIKNTEKIRRWLIQICSVTHQMTKEKDSFIQSDNIIYTTMKENAFMNDEKLLNITNIDISIILGSLLAIQNYFRIKQIN